MTKRSKLALKLILIPLLLCGLPIWILFAPFSSYSESQRCGAIQVLGSPNELWCFIEIDRWIGRPGLLTSPKGLAMGHSQELLIVSETGEVQRVPISIPDGVTFHPNISHIFRLEDDLYLYQDFSAYTHRSVYKWNADHFELLPLAQSEALLKQHSLDNIHPTDMDDAIENLLKKSGWMTAYKTGGMFAENEPTFDWQGNQFEIGNVKEDEKVSLDLRKINNPSWTIDFAAYDRNHKPLSRREHDALWDRLQQRGHPR